MLKVFLLYSLFMSRYGWELISQDSLTRFFLMYNASGEVVPKILGDCFGETCFLFIFGLRLWWKSKLWGVLFCRF
jgi:hypothetical protein